MKANIDHIIDASQFCNRNFLNYFFDFTDKIRKSDFRSRKLDSSLKNRIMAALFYEPSTRTRFSFESAMLRLGGGVISTESAGHFSSAIKGETLEDTIRIVGGYADVIVLRHNETGAAKRAASVSSVPIINAGDGAGEHPTQALLDIYTIWKEFGRIDDLKIILAGDLLYGRTIHSLIQLLSLSKKSEIFLVSPKELRLPGKYKKLLKDSKIKFYESDNFKSAIRRTDVFYMTRIQKERFRSGEAYEKIKSRLIVDRVLLKQMKKDAIIMHPLPRVSEISPEVDSDRRAAYFRQAQNGLYVRMALLLMLFGKTKAFS